MSVVFTKEMKYQLCYIEDIKCNIRLGRMFNYYFLSGSVVRELRSITRRNVP